MPYLGVKILIIIICDKNTLMVAFRAGIPYDEGPKTNGTLVIGSDQNYIIFFQRR